MIHFYLPSLPFTLLRSLSTGYEPRSPQHVTSALRTNTHQNTPMNHIVMSLRLSASTAPRAKWWKIVSDELERPTAKGIEGTSSSGLRRRQHQRIRDHCRRPGGSRCSGTPHTQHSSRPLCLPKHRHSQYCLASPEGSIRPRITQRDKLDKSAAINTKITGKENRRRKPIAPRKKLPVVTPTSLQYS